MTSMSFPGPIPPMTRLFFGTWRRRSSEPFAFLPSSRQTRQCSPPLASSESRSYPSEIMDPHVLQTHAVV